MSTRHTNNGLRKICACDRRAWPKCKHDWHVAFMWKGTHYRFSLDRYLGKPVESKTDAETEVEKIRTAIREGTFGQVSPVAGMTLRQLADVYLERYVDVRKQSRRTAFEYALNTICRTELPRPVGGALRFGDWRLDDIVTDTVERFREVRRGQGVTTGVNRNLQSLRAMWNWAIRTGYVERSPFRKHEIAVVKIAKSEETKRTRRLNPDTQEEARLLAACGPHLRAVVECAIHTGMRSGEIFSLQWHQVQGMTIGRKQTITWAPRASIFLPATKTKTKTDRSIPIALRLKAILEMRRFDPDNQPFAPDAYVFGNEIGQRIGDVGRAWETAVLRAHGHAVQVTKTGNLTRTCRDALHAVDLHLHDLRREAGSRWLEGGVPLHIVRDWLGHTSIAQTSTYLGTTLRTQHDAMAAFEAAGRLQKIAKHSPTGGRKSPRTAKTADRNPNKTTGHHDSTIM